MTPSRKSNIRIGPETRTVALRDLEVGDPVRCVGHDVFADVVSIDHDVDRHWPYRIELANHHFVNGRPDDRVAVLVP